MFDSGVGAAMFGGLTPHIGPEPEEIEAERLRVMSHKHVEPKGHHVRIYNMHDETERRAYEKQMMVLIAGTQARTHQVWTNDRQLITDNGTQRWVRYLEWSEFVLKEEATPPVGTRARR